MLGRKVFISYSKKDSTFANWLSGAIKDAGFSVWLDSQNLNPGENFHEGITEGIETSDVFAILLSKSSIQSRWIQMELNSALRRSIEKSEIKIVIIKIDDFPMPANLSNYIYVNAVEDKNKALTQILKVARDTHSSNLKFSGWNDFNPKSFENLTFEILQAEGRNISRSPIGRNDIGFDFKIEELNSIGEIKKTIVEAKLYSGKVGISEIMKLNQLVQTTGANYGLLVTSSELTYQTKDFILKTNPNITVWEGQDLLERINKYPHLAEKYFSEIKLSNEPVIIVDDQLTLTQQLIKELEDCPEGKEGWKKYEDICTRILAHLFVPPLSAPKIQSRRDNNIDIRDAVFPNRSNDENWRFLRENYDAKYIVAEFKNYAADGSDIDKYSVLQLGDYLKPFTLGRFGILCCRKEPIQSAIIKQKEFYSEHQKLIIFINDQKLKEMLLRKYKKLEPADVLFDLIDDFILNY